MHDRNVHCTFVQQLQYIPRLSVEFCKFFFFARLFHSSKSEERQIVFTSRFEPSLPNHITKRKERRETKKEGFIIPVNVSNNVFTTKVKLKRKFEQNSACKEMNEKIDEQSTIQRRIEEDKRK